MDPSNYSFTNNSHVTISDNWLRTSAVIHIYKARARRNGYRMCFSFFQFTYCEERYKYGPCLSQDRFLNHQITKECSFYFLEVSAKAFLFKKSIKFSKVLQAKMGHRMHQIALFFQKYSRGGMPPNPPSILSRLLCSHETLHVSNIAPPPPPPT